MMQRRYETEVTKLSQNSPSFFAVDWPAMAAKLSSRSVCTGIGLELEAHLKVGVVRVAQLHRIAAMAIV